MFVISLKHNVISNKGLVIVIVIVTLIDMTVIMIVMIEMEN